MDQSIFSAFGIRPIQAYLDFIPAEYWVLLTHLGASALTATLFMLACLFQRQRFALNLGFLTLLAGMSVIVLKHFIQQPRPYLLADDFNVYQMSTGFGMPSGHSANAFVMFFIIGLFLKSRLAWPLLLTLIGLAGLSRAYLGVHSLGQVGAGLALGAVVCAAYVLLSRGDRRAAQSATRTTILTVLALLTTGGYVAAHFFIETQIASSFSIPASWIDANHQAQQALAVFKGETVGELTPPLLFKGELLYLTALFLGISLSLIAYPYAMRGRTSKPESWATADLSAPINIGLSVIVFFLAALYFASQFQHNQPVIYGLLVLFPWVVSIGIPVMFKRRQAELTQ